MRIPHFDLNLEMKSGIICDV